MANRIGNKIWKEKSRRGMSRKRFWTKKLFYKAGKRNICRRNRIALHVQHARITALVFYNTFHSNWTEKHLRNFSNKSSRGGTSTWSMFLNGFEYLSLSDGWGCNFVMGWVVFTYWYRVFTASPWDKSVAEPTPHIMAKLSCKII